MFVVSAHRCVRMIIILTEDIRLPVHLYILLECHLFDIEPLTTLGPFIVLDTSR